MNTVIIGGDAFFGEEGLLELNAHIVGGTGHIDLIRGAVLKLKQSNNRAYRHLRRIDDPDTRLDASHHPG